MSGVKRLQQICELLGEGFFADKIVEVENKDDVFDYVEDIRFARAKLKSKNVYCELESLHRLTRFLSWFLERYGKWVVESREDAEAFLEYILDRIVSDRDTQLDFFGWLRKKTLEETSKMMYG